MDLKFKITASCFGSQEILTAPHMTYRSQSSYQCLSVKSPEKNSALVISFVPFKNFAVAWMDVVRVFFSACCRIVDSLLAAPGVAARAGSCSTLLEAQHRLLTNVGKIAVSAFNPIIDACYFFFRRTVLRFFEDIRKCAYGFNSSLYVEYVAVCVSPCPISLEHRVPRQGQQGQDGGFVGQTLVGQHFQ